jgi:hypothetical protein
MFLLWSSRAPAKPYDRRDPGTKTRSDYKKKKPMISNQKREDTSMSSISRRIETKCAEPVAVYSADLNDVMHPLDAQKPGSIVQKVTL